MYISLIFLFFFLRRYIKGRISYEQVNNAIDEIHKAITAKYKIMRLPRSAMGEPVMKKYKVSGMNTRNFLKYFVSVGKNIYE